MRLLDRNRKEIEVGDDVVFIASGILEKGYVYKKAQTGHGPKIYMTARNRNEQPTCDSHKELSRIAGTEDYITYYVIKI